MFIIVIYILHSALFMSISSMLIHKTIYIYFNPILKKIITSPSHNFVMVLLVIMKIVLVLMETVMAPVGLCW